MGDASIPSVLGADHLHGTLHPHGGCLGDFLSLLATCRLLGRLDCTGCDHWRTWLDRSTQEIQWSSDLLQCAADHACVPQHLPHADNAQRTCTLASSPSFPFGVVTLSLL